MLPILALIGLLSAAAGLAQTADLVVENARIYTVNPAQPTARAIAVKDGRILAVGNDVAKYAGPQTRRIDAKGDAIVPGLIDSHVHMLGLGALLDSFDLRHVKSIDEVASIVKKSVEGKPAGEWLQGRAWDETNWGGKFPDHKPLTAAAPNNPVYLRRVDGHAGWANKKAMEIAGVTKATPDPAGGKIIRDANGEPTGVFIDRAQSLVANKIPPPTSEIIERQLRRAAQECARLGLTGVHDAGVGAEEMQVYHKLRGQLPVRIYAMIGGNGALWRDYLKKGPEIDDYLTIRSIKLVADGAMGSRGAAFWQPYSDDPGNTGLLILSKEQIEAVARDAAKAGFQVNTHAIGDRANRTALDAYGAVVGEKNDKRFRIEHAQVVSLPDFALFAKYNVIASIQSTHATSDMRWASARLGPDRMMGAWAPQRFLKAGVRITNGSDTPVENPNPLWGFYAAITRQDHDGNPPGGFMPDQILSRELALKSWTLDGAYAAFQEKDRGSLEPGKLADFLILTKDIMTVEPKQILQTKVRMTVLGGKTVFSE